jgi:putative ABC transport system substrate-binding protein
MMVCGVMALVLAVALVAGALAAGAQQAGQFARVGFLSPGEKPGPLTAAFRESLQGLGWIEGQNLVIEYRFGGEQYATLRTLAADLVRRKVDVIFASSAPAAQAAKEATTAIPIVFHTLNDPVRAGFVASLARPGGNMTGNAGLGPELDRKRIELLKEVVPSLTEAMVLVNPSNPMTAFRLRVIEESAQALKVRVRSTTASDAKALDQALGTIARTPPAGLIIFEDPVFHDHRRSIIDLVARRRIPTVYTQSGWAELGGLAEYAPNQGEMFRQAARYVDRILKGARPADLPVEQPTKFELVINLKTAKALGLTLPLSLLTRADEIIQ